jgi:hypothetical protein
MKSNSFNKIPFNPYLNLKQLKKVRKRIDGFSKEYELEAEVENLINVISVSEKIENYPNKEDVAVFCISEILELTRKFNTTEKDVFLKSGTTPNLVKSFETEARPLIKAMINKVEPENEKQELDKDPRFTNPRFTNLIANYYNTGFGVEKNKDKAL